MPHIVCQNDNAIITRDKPTAPFNAQMATKYAPPKRFAYSRDVIGVTPVAGYRCLEFASAIPMGSQSSTQGWVKNSDWSFEP